MKKWQETEREEKRTETQQEKIEASDDNTIWWSRLMASRK